MQNILKKLAKPLIVLCLTAVLLTLVIQVANAEGPTNLLPKNIQLDLSFGLDGKTPESISNQLEYYDNLPEFDQNTIFRTAIKTMLYLAGFLVTLGLIVVGYMFMAGSANEESLTKARKILGYIGVGILIMAASYAIISGLLQIKLF